MELEKINFKDQRNCIKSVRNITIYKHYFVFDILVLLEVILFQKILYGVFIIPTGLVY